MMKESNLQIDSDTAMIVDRYRIKKRKSRLLSQRGLGGIAVLIFLYIATTSNNWFKMSESSESKPITYCLWFIPPEPHLTQISSQVKTLAELNDSPVFIPHVTVAGFIQLSDGTDTLVIQELQTAFKNFSDNGHEVQCKFDRSKGFVTKYDDNNQIIWTQACVGVVQRDEYLVKAVELAKKTLLESQYVLGDKDRFKPGISFAPPLNEPHLSFIYKTSPINILEKMEFPDDFISREIVLVKTDPCTFEYISGWEIVGSVKL